MLSTTAEYLTQLVKTNFPITSTEFLAEMFTIVATPKELTTLITELEIAKITNLTEGMAK